MRGVPEQLMTTRRSSVVDIVDHIVDYELTLACSIAPCREDPADPTDGRTYVRRPYIDDDRRRRRRHRRRRAATCAHHCSIVVFQRTVYSVSLGL